MAVGSPVVSGGDASPCSEPVDQAFDGVPPLVEIGVVADGSATSGALLLPVGGLVLLIRNDRLDTAFAQVGADPRGGYALSPATTSGRMRGLPTGPRARTFFRTGMNCGLSAAWPVVRMNAGGRHLRPVARWILLVRPPLECPRRAAFSRGFCRRRMRRRSSSAESLSTSCPFCSSRAPRGQQPVHRVLPRHRFLVGGRPGSGRRRARTALRLHSRGGVPPVSWLPGAQHPARGRLRLRLLRQRSAGDVERGSHRAMAECRSHSLIAATNTVASKRTASLSYRMATARCLMRRLIPHSTV